MKYILLGGVVFFVLFSLFFVNIFQETIKNMYSFEKDIFFRNTDLTISDELILNKEVYLTLAASNPMIDTNASLEIILPEGFQLVEGNLTWDGFMSKNQSKELKVKIKAIKEGEWFIVGWAGPSWNKKYDGNHLYVIVNKKDNKIKANVLVKNETYVSDSLKTVAIKLEDNKSSDLNEKDLTISSVGGYVNVEGYFYYRNEFGTGDIPIRYAKIDLYDAEPFPLPHALLATGYTDGYGRFYFSNIYNYDGPFEGGLDLYANVYADYWENPSYGVKVTDGNIFGLTYRSQTSTYGDVQDGYVWLGSWSVADATKRGSWSIYDFDVEAYQAIKNSRSWKLPKIPVAWPGETTGFLGFTWVINWAYGIEIDREYAWEKDVNQHEFSHAVMFKLFGDYLPPSVKDHWISMESNENNAITEGWAQYLPCVIQNSSDYRGSNMETEKFYNIRDSGDWDGHIIEGAVAATLWDISDSSDVTDDGSYGTDDDNIPGRLDRVWDVMRLDKPNGINEFWTKWFERGYDYEPEIRAIFIDNGIDKRINNGGLCSSDSECSSGQCEGSQSYSARCCSSAPPADGYACSSGNVRQYRNYYCDSGGNSNYEVTSSYDCDNDDGCYTYGNGCENRDYYCSGGSCTYSYSNRQTDYYDSFMYYCSGDSVRKHRLFHDYYCSGGTCSDHTNWADDQLVENCNDYEGWYDTSGWSCDGSCSRKKNQEYRDYYCSGGSCAYQVTSTRTYYENCPAGSACSGGGCSSSYYCDSTFRCSSGSGDNNFNIGGQYRCQGRCDGGNNCDYAVNCADCGTDTCYDSGDSWTVKEYIIDYEGCSSGACGSDDTRYDYCVGDTVYDRRCGTSDEGPATSKNCNDYDTNNCWCTAGGSLNEVCDNWNCNDGACKDSGSDWTRNTWSCGSGNECGTQNCKGTAYKCYRTNPGAWNWASSAESTETNCNDGYDNDCDGYVDKNDSGCPQCNQGETRLCPKQQGVCSGAYETCNAQGRWPGCNASNYGQYYEENEVTCDGKDNDCDGQADEDGNALCSDGLYCNGQETCGGVNGCQAGTPIDCSVNNLPETATCTNNPDNNPYTWDYAKAFVSSCDESNDKCTTGSYSFTHTCNITGCGAECEGNNDCENKCVGSAYYYGGECQADCGCQYQTEDCDQHDGWYNTTNTRWVETGQCTEKEQKEQKYRNYGCGEGGCSYTITQNRWVDTGKTRNKPDETPCDDGLFCTVNDKCKTGVCGGIARSCSDGVDCTDDSCDEGNDKCVNLANNTKCDDGLWCNGFETCDNAFGCKAGTPVNCSDGNECTDDICNETLDQCGNPNLQAGTLCGLNRDCPEDQCNGYFVEFYPEDGHDTCDGNGNCLMYSCAMTNTYCTDDDPYDLLNTFECGAPCDQDSDCGPYCAEDFRYYGGACSNDCICSYSTEECNDYDCSTGIVCTWMGSSEIYEKGDDYSCREVQCVPIGKCYCSDLWACNGSSECSAGQECAGQTYKCYYNEKFIWESDYPANETNCTDKHDNDCDGLADARDPDCPSPDLVVAKALIYPQNPVTGENLVIEVTLQNIGKVATDNVYWEIDTGSDDPNPKSTEPISLGVNQKAMFNVGFNYTKKGIYSASVIVDPDDVVDESDEDNNILYLNISVIEKRY